MGDDVYKRSREGIVKVNRDGSKTVAYQSDFGKEFRYQRNQFQNEILSRESAELHRNDSFAPKMAEVPTEERIQTLHSVKQQNGEYLERGRNLDASDTPVIGQNELLPEGVGVVSHTQNHLHRFHNTTAPALQNEKHSSTELKEPSVLDWKSMAESAVSRTTFLKSDVDNSTLSGIGIGKGVAGTVASGTSHVINTSTNAAQRGVSFVQTSASGESNQDVGDKAKQYLVTGTRVAAGKVKDTGVKAVKKVSNKTVKTVRHKVQKQVQKTAAKAGQKAAAKTAQATARAVERAAAKAAQVAAKTVAQAAAHTAATTARTTVTVTQVIASNPVTLFIAGVLLFLILMCSLGAMMGGTGLITERLDPSYNMPWYELREYISTLETQALQDAEQSLRDEVERINAGGYIPPNMATPADGSLWYVSVMSIDGTTSLRQVQQIIRLMVGCCFSNLNFVEGGDNYEEKKAFIDKLYGSWEENQNDGILWSWKPYIYDTGVIDSNGLHLYKVMYCISINDLDTIKSRVGVGLSNEGSMMTTEQWNTFADAYGAYDWWAQQDLDQFWNDEIGDPIYSDETTIAGTFILDTRISYYGDDKIVAGSFGASINEQDYLDPSANVGQDALDYEQQITREPNGTEHHTHNGIDLVSNPGVHVVSATDGTVVAVGKENSYSGLAEQDHGNYVTILCQDNIMMTYSHLDEVAVEVGQSVSVASYLGTVGRSGKISPTIEATIDDYVERLYNNGQWYVDESLAGGDKWGYVHFEVTINGYYANPNEYMGLGELEYNHN